MPEGMWAHMFGDPGLSRRLCGGLLDNRLVEVKPRRRSPPRIDADARRRKHELPGNALGLVVHPVTGELWENENGPQGGDEINIIRPGRNYGWPIISYGRAYIGQLEDVSGPSSEVTQ